MDCLWVRWGSFGGYLGSCSGRLEAILGPLELSWSIVVLPWGYLGSVLGQICSSEAVWRSVSLLGALKVDGP